MRISPKVGVLLLVTLGLCVGVHSQGKHSSSHWRACMQLPKVRLPRVRISTILISRFDDASNGLLSMV